MLAVVGAARAQDQKLPQGVDVTSSTFRSERRDFSEEHLRRLQTPVGFKVSVFATGLGRPRMMVVADDGTLYITRRSNDVVALKDTNGDGKSDEMKVTPGPAAGARYRPAQPGSFSHTYQSVAQRTHDDGSLSPPCRIAAHPTAGSPRERWARPTTCSTSTSAAPVTTALR
jgi:glucose/arabinose dehydrogenase